jgi:hypothetical protein
LTTSTARLHHQLCLVVSLNKLDKLRERRHIEKNS